MKPSARLTIALARAIRGSFPSVDSLAAEVIAALPPCAVAEVALERLKEPPTREVKRIWVRLRRELTNLLRSRSVFEWLTFNCNEKMSLLLELVLRKGDYEEFKRARFKKVAKVHRRVKNKPTTRIRVISTPWAEVFFSSDGADYAYTVVHRGEPTEICASLRDAFRCVMSLSYQTTDPEADDHLGIRVFAVDPLGTLFSPIRGTKWKSRFLKADKLSLSDEVECQAGVHAKRLPYRWRDRILECAHFYLVVDLQRYVVGLVRRHGRAVVGEQGWRAEGAEILELWTSDELIATRLMLNYPGAAVHFVPLRS